MGSYDDLIKQLARQHQSEVEAATVELTLWTLVKGPQRAEARTKRHPVGIELVVTIDGELLWSQTFAPQLVETLLESAASAQQKVLVADGWQPAGPQAN